MPAVGGGTARQSVTAGRLDRVIGGNSATGIFAVSRDPIGELKPGFGDEEKARFVGEHSRSFCQIKADGRPPPVLEFQTHVRTQPAWPI